MNKYLVSYKDNEGNQYSVIIEAYSSVDALNKFIEKKPWDCEIVLGAVLFEDNKKEKWVN